MRFLIITQLALAVLSIQASAAPVLLVPDARHLSRQCFIENRGQWHPDVLFLWRAKGLEAWVTRSGVVYDFYNYRQMKMHPVGAVKAMSHPQGKFDHEPIERYGHVIRLSHVGGSASPFPRGINPSPTYHNYFIGNQPARWATRVPLYDEVRIETIHPGIHQRWYVENGRLRYDYLIEPGADPSLIRLLVEGTDSVRIEGDRLLFHTRFGMVEHAKLYAYQEIDGRKVTVPVSWVLEGHIVRFGLGGYDPNRLLVIDPLLVWSTFLGGEYLDYAFSIAIDGNKSVLVTGIAASSQFPTTVGSYDETFNSMGDVFVSKLDSTGATLIWSTFIGGNKEERGLDIEIASDGTVYVVGATESNTFPVTIGCYDSTHNGGGSDAFMLRLSSDGTSLLGSTFLGGARQDLATSIVMDGRGGVYVSGHTQSFNFPMTTGSYQTIVMGGFDVFVAKLNTTGTSLLWGTLIGSSGDDNCYDLAIDDNGSLYLTGYTEKTLGVKFPTTPGSYTSPVSNPSDVYDIFVTKLNNTGSALVWSTAFGGSNNDFSHSIAVDRSGAVYVTGYTSSPNFPTTPGSYDQTHGGGNDVFVTKLNSTGSALLWSTYLGGGSDEIGNALVVDGSGAVYVTGMTGSPNFPVTDDGYDRAHNGRYDVFLVKLNSSGSAIAWGTFIGGERDEWGTSLIVDHWNAPYIAVYITGATESPYFPTTDGSYDQQYGGGYGNAFVLKLHIPFAASLQASASSLWHIAPNPIAGTFILHHAFSGEREFELLDLGGRVLQRWTLAPGTHHLRLDLSAGMYMIREQESGTIQRLICVE